VCLRGDTCTGLYGYQNGPWTKTAHVDVQNGPLLGQQESRAVAKKPRDAAAVLFGLKFADNIHCKIKSSPASKARLSDGLL